tara:strand:- start:89 stop:331 length:243 start_codon:yes stop_codon:yes gene_type:complete
MDRQNRDRYDKLSRELDKVEAKNSNTLLKKFKRKVEGLYKSEDQMQDEREMAKRGQRTLSGRHYSLLKRVEELEEYMNRD